MKDYLLLMNKLNEQTTYRQENLYLWVWSCIHPSSSQMRNVESMKDITCYFKPHLNLEQYM